MRIAGRGFVAVLKPAAVAASAVSLSVLAACRTASSRTDGAGSAGLDGELSFRVQYFAAPDVAEDETAEVLVCNGTETPVRFVGAELDGTPLPQVSPKAAKAVKAFTFSGVGAAAGLRLAAARPVAGARWWRFSPSASVPPGGRAVFQLNFCGKSRLRELALTDEGGRRHPVKVPRRPPSVRRIEHLAFSGDGRRIVLRYSKGGAPSRMFFDGASVPFRVLEPETEARPGAVVAELRSPVAEGDCALVEVEFPDGSRPFAFTRAMLGVCTVAPRDAFHDFDPLPDSVRKDYGFDDGMRVYRIPCDVACDDTRAHEHGANARIALAEGETFRKDSPKALCGVDFCTALYPSVWNIYAPIGDVVIAKPYKLHWGASPGRFLDEEDAFLADVVTRVSPRPVMWVPERFRRGRELDGGEFSVLAWCAMLRGVRGVRVHHWLNDRDDPFAGNPGLAAAVREFNAGFSALRPRLDGLVPVGASEDRSARVAVLEGWSGDDGALLLVRNLRYDTGIDPRAGLRVRPFAVAPIRDYALSYRLPKWLAPDAAVDALSGERLEGAESGGVFKATIPELGPYRLVWIGNAKKGGGR